MSSPKYDHRSFQPTCPPSQGTHTQLNEAFEAIRREVDGLTFDLGLLRNQRDEYESKVTSQVNELNIIRQSLYELESQHSKVRQKYEDELLRLRAELRAVRRGTANAPPHHDATTAAGPASVEHSGCPVSPASLPGALPSLGLGSSNDPYYVRDRDRDASGKYGIPSGGEVSTTGNSFSKFDTRSVSKQSA